MDIFAHPKSSSAPMTAQGTAYQDALEAFARRWQSGTVKDLARGLREVDRQINGRARAHGPGVEAPPALAWHSPGSRSSADLSAAALR
jgi:hypothetical protein